MTNRLRGVETLVLRIHFTPEDLLKVRVAGAPHPLWELVLSINSLQQPELPLRYRTWRDGVLHRARQRSGSAGVLQAASSVVPLAGNFPDLLTPDLDEPDAQAHFDGILSLPKATVRADLVRTYRKQLRPPVWAARLHSHGRSEGLVRVLRAYRDLAFDGPLRRDVQQGVERARARCAERMLAGGVGALLSGLHPSIRWQYPVLEADYGSDLDLWLSGRGLMIVPAYFNYGRPITLINGELSPTLVCPAVQGADDAIDPGAVGGLEELINLIGRTRANLLAELDIAASTQILAHRLGITAGAISQHTKVLREAGLVSTSRTGQSVRHSLTPLARSLLDRT